MTIKVALVLALGATMFAPASVAQQEALPEMEIYLSTLTVTDDGISVGTPENVTRHPGYDNQPWFLPDGASFLYASEGATGKMDAWRYDIATATKVQLTHTPTVSEYSPKLAPDGKGLMLNHEPPNGTGQQIWYFDPDDPDLAGPVLDYQSTGYHAWAQKGKYLAVFALGDPPTLRLADMKTGELTVMFENIGRALYALPDDTGFTFTEPLANGQVRVHRLDVADRRISSLFELPGKNEHYALMPNAANPNSPNFLSADGSKLFYRDGANGAGWTEVADFSGHGVRNITRLAVSSDLKFVALVVAQ